MRSVQNANSTQHTQAPAVCQRLACLRTETIPHTQTSCPCHFKISLQRLVLLPKDYYISIKHQNRALWTHGPRIMRKHKSFRDKITKRQQSQNTDGPYKSHGKTCLISPCTFLEVHSSLISERHYGCVCLCIN